MPFTDSTQDSVARAQNSDSPRKRNMPFTDSTQDSVEKSPESKRKRTEEAPAESIEAPQDILSQWFSNDKESCMSFESFNQLIELAKKPGVDMVDWTVE